MPQTYAIFCTTDGADAINGINVWLLRLLPRLQAAGIRIAVLVYAWSDEENCTSLPIFRRLGVETHFIDFLLPTEAAVLKTIQILAKEQPNIFVANHVVQALYTARWARGAGIATVAVLHNDDGYYRTLARTFGIRNPLWRVDHIVHVSPELRLLAARNASSSAAVTYLPCSVPLSGRTATPPEKTLKLVYIGRISQEQKRIIDTIRIVVACAKAFPQIEADFYGSGPDFEAASELLRSEAQDLPIRLHGRVSHEQAQEILARSHVFILLSDYEGMPVALMEAMAAGLVPICSAIRSGVPALVSDPSIGFTVRDRAQGVHDALGRLVSEPGLWSRMSRAAREKIRSEFTIENNTEDWKNLLVSLSLQSSVDPTFPVPAEVHLPPRRRGFGGGDNRPMPLTSRLLGRLTRMVLQ